MSTKENLRKELSGKPNQSLNKTISTSAVFAEVKRNRVNMCWKTDAERAEIISALELSPNFCPVLHRGLTRTRDPWESLHVA
jgi:hypothetical protein